MATSIKYWNQLPTEIKCMIISKCTFEDASNFSVVDKETLLLCLTEPSSPLLQKWLSDHMLRNNTDVVLRSPRIFKAGSLYAYWTFSRTMVANWDYLRRFCDKIVAVLGPSPARVEVWISLFQGHSLTGKMNDINFDMLENLNTLNPGICGSLHLYLRYSELHDLVIPNAEFTKIVYLHDRDFGPAKTTILNTFLRELRLEQCRFTEAGQMIDLTALQGIEELEIHYPVMDQGRLIPWSFGFPQHVGTLLISLQFWRGPDSRPQSFALNHLDFNLTHLDLTHCCFVIPEPCKWPRTLQSLSFTDADLGCRRLADTLFPRTFRRLTICNFTRYDFLSLHWLLDFPQTLPEHTELSIQTHTSNRPDVEPEYSDLKQRIDKLDAASLEARYLQMLCESILQSHQYWLKRLAKQDERNNTNEDQDDDGDSLADLEEYNDLTDVDEDDDV